MNDNKPLNQTNSDVHVGGYMPNKPIETYNSQNYIGGYKPLEPVKSELGKILLPPAPISGSGISEFRFSCSDCNGSGKGEMGNCNSCEGSGFRKNNNEPTPRITFRI